MNTGFWVGNLNKTDHLQDLGVDERIILKMDRNVTHPVVVNT
jgi:hypothetical protein